MTQRLLDIAERVGSTFVVTLLGALVIANVADVHQVNVALVAALAAALAVLKNLVTEFAAAANGLTWWQDAALRTMATYVQTFVALVLTDAGGVAFSSWRLAAYAAIPAALTVLKSLLAAHLPWTDSRLASVLPLRPPRASVDLPEGNAA
jgi:hypothetical protein